MAKIPEIAPARRTARTNISVAVDDSSAIIARGIADIVERRQDRQDKFNYARAKNALLSADADIRSQLEEDDDWETYEERYREAMSKALDEGSGIIRHNEDRALFTDEAKLSIERGAATIRGASREREIDWGRARLLEDLEDLHRVGVESDVGTRMEVITSAQDTIDGALDNGYINEVEAQGKRRAWGEEYARGYINAQNPQERIKLLMQPDNTPAALLSLDDRMLLLESAERDRIAEVNAAYTESVRAQKELEDETSKTGDRMMAEGLLTTSWIEDNRDNLSPEDYRYYYQKMSGRSEGPRDPIVYSDLRESASRGDDVRDAAREALHEGAIRVSDYNTLLSEVETSRSNWYERGTDYISTSAAVSDLNPDPAAAQRKADMLDDWRTWSDDNSSATEGEAQEAYRRIVREYSIVDRDNMILTQRQPRYLVGGYTNPDIAATKKATREAFNAGQMTEKELDEQIALIEHWDQILKKADGTN
jgi:hypothetical protein